MIQDAGNNFSPDRPPPICYTLVNGFFGLLWAVGIPVVFCVYFSLWFWLKIPVVVVWLILSGRVVDRYIPYALNPVIEWAHGRISR